MGELEVAHKSPANGGAHEMGNEAYGPASPSPARPVEVRLEVGNEMGRADG